MNKISYLLVSILVLVVVIVNSITITILYNTAFVRESEQLTITARSQANMIDAVARYDRANLDKEDKSVAEKATLSQLLDAHRNFGTFGETGEFTVARLDANHIIYLSPHRFEDKFGTKEYHQPINLGSPYAIAMQKALNGQSGTVVASDYRGMITLAAYEYVPGLDYGVVAKMDLSEIRRPFIRAGLISNIVAIPLVIIGAFFLLHINKPVVQRLRESEDYNRVLFETLPVGLALCRMDGTLVDVNPAYADIIGRSIEETKKLSYWEITPQDYAPDEEIQLKKLNTSGHYGPYEKEYLHNDGQRVPVSLIGQVVELNGEKYIWSSVEDITQRRLAEEKVRGLNSELERRVKERTIELEDTLDRLKQTQSHLVHAEKMASLGQLTAGIGHEINNPVNFIHAGIHALQENIEDIRNVLRKYDAVDVKDPVPSLLEIREYKDEIQYNKILDFIDRNIGNIKNGVSRTVKIIDGLRVFSQGDSEQMISADIHQNMEATLIMLHAKYVDRIEIVKDYGKLLEILCYPGQLNQVFANILANSIDAVNGYQKPGEGVIKISTFLNKDAREVTVKIQDNGPGIEKEILDRIFEPFFTTKKVGEGTGLGLSISYSIMQNHQGKLLVNSVPGQGATFSIVIPVIRVNDK
ncbi:MAG: ATP-binding protein [Cyclobacteriaceae bacterium]|nr:ATP-binding protein [Cyclobacteriaceae bacterium]